MLTPRMHGCTLAIWRANALPEPVSLGVGLILVLLATAVALLGQARQEAQAGHAGHGRA